jgi:hypothetical protein
MRVVGEVVCACRQAVLQPTVTRVDGGGGLQWLELMVEAACVMTGADGRHGVRAYG